MGRSSRSRQGGIHLLFDSLPIDDLLVGFLAAEDVMRIAFGFTADGADEGAAVRVSDSFDRLALAVHAGVRELSHGVHDIVCGV